MKIQGPYVVAEGIYSVLVPGVLHPYIRNKFKERFQFNPADRPKPVSVFLWCPLPISN